MIKTLAGQVAETHAISKQTQKYITSGCASNDFPVKTPAELGIMEDNLIKNPEYRQDVVSNFNTINFNVSS